MRQPKIQPLIALIFGTLQVFDLLFLTHTSPLPIPHPVPPDIIDLRTTVSRHINN